MIAYIYHTTIGTAYSVGVAQLMWREKWQTLTSLQTYLLLPKAQEHFTRHTQSMQVTRNTSEDKSRKRDRSKLNLRENVQFISSEQDKCSQSVPTRYGLHF